jgi:hypothetical protein
MMAPAPMLDDDELEILARLDAILPGGGSSKSDSAPKAAPPQPPPPAPAPAVESRMASARSSPAASVASAVEEPQKDMFATSFLSSGASAEVANETNRAAESFAEPAIVIEEETEADDEAQVVPFESKRGRKKDRKSKKGPAATTDHHAPIAASEMGSALGTAPAIAREPVALPAPAAEVPFTPTAASAIPDMDVMLTESAPSSRPWWVSVAIAVVLLGAAAFLMYVYLGGLFGGPSR